ncbi:GDCCVxC domain-containing (seleno)protein [Providencia sp. Je.9.19]|uniref:GDCCVxC domain-containing (seleno)protein n=1 Tax=unclassified Providencia TaxID=2633465 RepID=UPI003DA9660B
MSKTNIELKSTITCPECGASQVEEMPTNACQWFYECKHCGVLLKPLEGDCCVFCSYGSVKCPPIQEANLSGVASCCTANLNN